MAAHVVEQLKAHGDPWGLNEEAKQDARHNVPSAFSLAAFCPDPYETVTCLACRRCI
jgi:hypothetical protein